MKLLLSALCALFLCTAAVAQNDSIKVTVREGTNMSIALSPDKAWIAMDLQGTLYVMPATGGTAKRITDYLGDCRQPAWSPDGKSIVFQSYRDGGWHLWKVNPDGTQLTQLTFGIYDDREPQYAPDGKKIIFSSDRNMNYDIWEMDIASEAVKQITKDLKNDYNPSYSPDGKAIAFISERTGKPMVYIRNEDGSETEVAGGLTTAAAPAWSTDAKNISFYTSNGVETRLFQVDLVSKKVSDLTDPKEDAFPFRAVWTSPTTVMYTADGQIKTKDLAKKKTTALVWSTDLYLHRPPYTRKKYDWDSQASRPVKGLMTPAVSPDGKKIVFSALGNLWLLTIGNPTPTQITNNKFVNLHPAWSPDGTKIAYITDREGSLDVWVKDLSSHTDRALTRTVQNETYPTWSPDGKSIAYFQAEGNSLLGGSSLMKVEANGGEPVKLHGPITTPSQPSWSPTGEHLMVSAMIPFSSRYREGLNKFLVMSTKGEADRYISPIEGKTVATRSKNGPVWSPNGRNVAYIQDGVLWILPVTLKGEIAGPPQRLTNELSDCPTWTGDSKTLVYLSNDKFRKVQIAQGDAETVPLEMTWKPHQPSGRKIIHAGKLFDGKTGSYSTMVDIVIEGNRIKEIKAHADHGNAELVDAGTRTVIPGMFDMHAHQSETEGEKTGRGWLAFGITSVREPGSDPYDAAARKEIWASGARPGPREFFTGYLQDGSRVYYNLANSNSSGNAELELGRAKALDYDFMKTYVRMPDYLQKRFTQYAHSLGIPVSSHEIFPSTSYGVDAIEHVGATSRRGYSPVRSNIGRSYQDVTDLITYSRMKITPTAALYGGFNLLTMKDPMLFQNPQYVGIYSESYRKSYEAFVKTAQAETAPSQAMLSGFRTTVNKLIAQGNHITAGTDAPFMPYGLSIQLEIITYVEILGVSPFHALQSATLWAAESAGVDKDLGSIEPGKLADLVIVDGDPLKNIKDALNVKVTVKNGVVYSLEELLKN